MNSIVYDLENGSYDLEVRTGPECKVTKKMMKLSFEAKSEIVSGFLVRSLNGDLNVMSIREAEEPKKRDDAAPKFKYSENYINRNFSENPNATSPTYIFSELSSTQMMINLKS